MVIRTRKEQKLCPCQTQTMYLVQKNVNNITHKIFILKHGIQLLQQNLYIFT